MRFPIGFALAGLLLSTGTALAAPAASGLIVAGGAATGAAVLSKELFKTSNTGAKLAHAPEISSTGSVGGLILLAGGFMILRGRQRLEE